MSGSEDTYLNFWKLELNDLKDSALCRYFILDILFIYLLYKGCLEASLKVSFRIAD